MEFIRGILKLGDSPHFIFVLILTTVIAVFVAYLFFLLRTGKRIRNLAKLLRRLGFRRELTLPIQRARSLREMLEGVSHALESEFEHLRRKLAIQTEATRNLSHDLGSPLTSIIGYTETLLEKNEKLAPADRVAFLKIIHRNSKSLRSMVAQFLEISSLEDTSARIRTESVDLHSMLEQVHDQFRPIAEKRQVRLTLCTDSNPLRAVGDPNMLMRAVANLVENAIRYTPPAGSVQICGERCPAGCRVAVNDSGEGISAEDLPHLFEPFFRASKARTRSSDGMGLGLSIVNRILELHGSAPIVESTPGIGSSFSFVLRDT